MSLLFEQAAKQVFHHVGGAVAGVEDLSRPFYLRCHAFRFNEINQVAWPKCGQGRMQEAALPAVGRNDAGGVGVVRQIAPRPARHQNLDARPPVFLQQQRTPSTVGRAGGRQQSGSAGADDDDVV